MGLSPSDVGKVLPEREFNWSDQAAILYALGVGAGPDDLQYLYEDDRFTVLPTFGVVAAFKALADGIGTLDFDRRMTLHGAHVLTLHAAIPREGSIVTTPKIVEVCDKGDNAVIVAEGTSVSPAGEALFTNRFSAFVRGGGGFGGARGGERPHAGRPARAPDRTVDLATNPSQALLYRLCGDRNPLHVDPFIARQAGFDRPILHGLCSFGFVGRWLFDEYCEGDPARFRSLAVRFSGIVFPGETIVLRCWESASEVCVEATTKERGGTALTDVVLRYNG